MSRDTIEESILQSVISEVKKIKDLPISVLNYMLNEENWIYVDPDGEIGASSPAQYPHEVIALRVIPMPENIKKFFGKVYPCEEELYENEEENTLEIDLHEDRMEREEDYMQVNHTVFAPVFWDSILNDVESTLDLMEGELQKEDPDYVLLFNGCLFSHYSMDDIIAWERNCLDTAMGGREYLEIFQG